MRLDLRLLLPLILAVSLVPAHAQDPHANQRRKTRAAAPSPAPASTQPPVAGPATPPGAAAESGRLSDALAPFDDPAGVGQGIGLADADAIFRTGNPDIRQAARAVAGADADIERAAARPNPQLSTELQNGRVNSYELRSYRQLLRVDQLIERGDKRRLRTDVAGAIAEATRRDLTDTVRQQRLAVHAAYFELAAAEQRARIAREDAMRWRRLIEAAERRVRAGDLARVDVARLRVDGARLENEARRAIADRESAQIGLAQLLGLPSASRLAATDPLPPQPDMPLPAEGDAVATEALVESRPDVRAAFTRVAAARRAVELAEALRTRDVTVSAAAEHVGPIGGSTVLAGFSVPLFLNYDYRGEIRRARADADAADESLDRTRAAARNDIRLARSTLLASADRLRRAHDHILPDADEAAAGVEFAFNRGAAALTDLLDAQRTNAAARLDAINASADYAKARAGWMAATNWYVASDGNEINTR